MSKLLFFVADDWYFSSHRLDLAVQAKKNKFDVSLLARVNNHKEKIEQHGINVIPLNFMSRGYLKPFRDLRALNEARKKIIHESPDLLHLVAMKPILFGALIAKFYKIPFVCSFGGFGIVFSSKSLKMKILSFIMATVFKVLLSNERCHVIVQNSSDYEIVLQRLKLKENKVSLLGGVGVDINKFKIEEIPTEQVIVMLAARMLKSKGVNEFAFSARRLRKKYPHVRFVLVGGVDPENPDTMDERVLEGWNTDGIVEWWGHREEMQSVLSQASIVCLPTYYGEGKPKILLEALATGRPIVTTNIPGCADLVVDGKNGILVEPKNIDALSSALELLICSPKKWQEIGAFGRKIAEKYYDSERVTLETVSIYSRL